MGLGPEPLLASLKGDLGAPQNCENSDSWHSSSVKLRRGAVAWTIGHRSVYAPLSSNRTCGFPASGTARGKMKTVSRHHRYFCFWLKADIQSPEIEVRFTPKTGHRRRDVRFGPDYVRLSPNSRHSRASAGLPLMTQSGSRAT